MINEQRPISIARAGVLVTPVLFAGTVLKCGEAHADVEPLCLHGRVGMM